MKFLLTSAGISNDSISNALVDLLGKPIAASTAMFIPTAGHAIPGGPFAVWRSTREWVELGWKAFGVLELTALPSIRQEYWLPQLEAADALLVGGGENLYLCYWARQKLSPRAIGNGLRPNGGWKLVRSCAPNERGATESLPRGSVFHWFELSGRHPYACF